jgi:hypothetical protein
MEKIHGADTGVPTLLVDCSPKELRELADHLEKTALRAIPGSSIILKFSKSVSLHYNVPTDFKFVASTYRDKDPEY